MNRDQQITAIAEAFAEVMRQWLSAAEFAEMKRRNSTLPAYAGNAACASQDFCDANMAMDEAMRKVFPDYEIEDESMHPIWNDAWSLAKKLYFGGVA